MRSTENVKLPENATIPPEWIFSEECGNRWIRFPSNTSPELHLIWIRKTDGLMGCSCLGYVNVGICSHIKKLRWLLSKKPRGTKPVSLEAKLSLTREYLSAVKLRILEDLKDKPQTCDELEGNIINLQDRSKDQILGKGLGERVSELHKAGWIEPTGEERPTRHGRMATVWRIA